MRIINKLLELVFPERPTHKIIRENPRSVTESYFNPTLHGDFTFLLPYNEPLVRAYIIETKFHHNEIAWEALAEVLKKYLKEISGDYVLLPIPLSKNREKTRKYNQVTEIARIALKELPNIKLETNVLYRKIDTVPQTSLARNERLQNVSEAFAVHKEKSGVIENQNVILLDDVATTGATLAAAKAALLPFGPKTLTLIALAH